MELKMTLYRQVGNYAEYKLSYRSDDVEIVRIMDNTGKCLRLDGFTDGNMPREAVELARLYLKGMDVL